MWVAPRAGAWIETGDPKHKKAGTRVAPARGATLVPAFLCLGSPVSIHAPARGATHILRNGAAQDSSSNPRPRAGGDHGDLRGIHGHETFQSTPPRGGRPPLHYSTRQILQ